MGRKGVSPVVATVVMLGLVLSMAGGVYVFLSDAQESVTDETSRGELETRNVSCMPERVEWWINNTGEEPVTGEIDLYFYGEDGLNTSLSRTGLIPGSGFVDAYGSGKLSVTPGGRLGLGEEYTLELDTGSSTLSASCTVGGEWWDQNWRYRRALEIEDGPEVTVNISLEANELVEEGKLRSDCADARIVNRGEVSSYDIRSCDSDGSLEIIADLSNPEPGRTYLYYGNLQAGNANVSVSEDGIFTSLGPEERINLY